MSNRRSPALWAAGGCDRSVRPGGICPGPGKETQIGVVYDLTGPLGPGGSGACSTSAQRYARSVHKTGVEATNRGDLCRCQSKPDVAINEAVRLISRKKSTWCWASTPRRSVPVAPASRSSEIHVDHHLHLLGRLEKPHLIRLPRAPTGQHFGTMTMDFITRTPGEVWQGGEGPARRHHHEEAPMA